MVPTTCANARKCPPPHLIKQVCVRRLELLHGGDAVRHPSCVVSRGGEKRLTESRFATLNVGGGMNKKLNEVLKLMDERKIDVLCVNETKRKGCDTTTQGSYTAYWSGVPSSDRGCKGVGVILSARMTECVNEFECVSPRLIWVRMKVGCGIDAHICCWGLRSRRSGHGNLTTNTG